MKIKVFDKTVIVKEQEIFLKLEQRGSIVALILVDEHGEKISAGNLLEIGEDMTIYRHGSINSTIGLPLNKEKQLKIVGEDD